MGQRETGLRRVTDRGIVRGYVVLQVAVFRGSVRLIREGVLLTNKPNPSHGALRSEADGERRADAVVGAAQSREVRDAKRGVS